MVMRYLGIDAEKWDRLPLWVQRIYREGLEYERPWDEKPDRNPQSWWSPLDEIWSTFGELEKQPSEAEQTEPKHSQKRKLPDIKSAGVPLKIKKGKVT